MKILRVCAALLTLALFFAAALAEPAADAWQSVPHEAAELPADAQAAFDAAVEGLTDVEYVPVALLSTQGEAAMNYCVLCQFLPASADAKPGWVLVYVRGDGNGGAAIGNVYELYIDRHSTPAE